MLVRFFFALFALILTISKVVLPLFIGVILACFLCNIHYAETYSWLSGIWHGMFFIPNYIRHIYDPFTLYKATSYTAMYNFYWWIFAIIEILSAIPVVIFVISAPIAAIATSQDEWE